MFDSAARHAARKPDLVHGSYPQREEPRIGALERNVSRVIGFARQHLLTPANRFQRVVEAVAGHGPQLLDLSDAGLARRVHDLRPRLAYEGLTEPLVCETFAVVRELSGRTLGMRHYDEQLLGGWVLVRGMVAEMQTGEGKTLTATLAACAAALAGVPVHVVTVNDYLVTRDSAWMAPLYAALGLSVGTITEGMSPDERRAAYACDVTYCSNKQLVFDYLRDRLTLGQRTGRLRRELGRLRGDGPGTGALLMRGLCYAIVDEADSVLVDEARTPLIISRGGDGSGEQQLYEQALSLARDLQPERDYSTQAQHMRVELTDRGRARLEDMAASLGGIWAGRQRREDLARQALMALHLFRRDQHYLVKDGKVQIVDEYTGRAMPDRSWEQGLHQLIEAKEGCAITAQPETLARISYQRFFRRYLRLGGMTGTAREVAGELWAVYRLGVVVVHTHRRSRRERLVGRMHRDAEARWAAVIADIRERRHKGQPVLVGTRSAAASEAVSERLGAAGIDHEVLNARQDENEAAIIAAAGQRGRVTVATNMAGRGTDIELGAGVDALGGLHVILTEGHDARRIDRQLAGRCARQGDPGSTVALLSLDDELMRGFYPRWFLSWLAGQGAASSALLRILGEVLVRWPQWAAERRHARMRRDLLASDERLGNLLAFSGREE